MPELRIDFETFSTLDLPDVGAEVYAAHSTTGVWCAAFAVDDGVIDLWTDGENCPDAIARAVSERWTIHAHNANFERVIWRRILTPRYGWPEPVLEQWRCSMAMSLAAALPGKLEKAAAALDLPACKDMEGHRLMLRMAQPRRPRRDEDPNRLYWRDDAESLAQLCTRPTLRSNVNLIGACHR
jgi:DNA polymerase